jgi:K+/H+ antiporter YhaU regulatory subunit KhtT
MLSPTVVDFLDTILKKGDERLNIEDIEIAPTDLAVGQSLQALSLRDRSGAAVLVVTRAGQTMANPEAGLVLQAGDRLLALGTTDQLGRLVQLITAG